MCTLLVLVPLVHLPDLPGWWCGGPIPSPSHSDSDTLSLGCAGSLGQIAYRGALEYSNDGVRVQTRVGADYALFGCLDQTGAGAQTGVGFGETDLRPTTCFVFVVLFLSFQFLLKRDPQSSTRPE